LETIEVLKKTKEKLRAHGWTKGGEGWSGGHTGNGPLCLEGALLQVLGHQVDWAVGEPNMRQSSALLGHPAYKLLSKLAWGDDLSHYRLSGWNDSHSEWAVHDLLKRAIKKLEKEQPKAEVRELEVIIPPIQCEMVNGEKPASIVQIVSGVPDYVPESWSSKIKEKVLTFV